MKKFISDKSIPTVAVSMPKPGDDGGFVAFLHEKAGSFNMACSLHGKKENTNVKNQGFEPRIDSEINTKVKDKNGLDAIDEEEEAATPGCTAQAHGATVAVVKQTKIDGLKLFEDDERKMDKLHEEAKRRYTAHKKEELLLMDKEFEALNRDIDELIRKEGEEIRYLADLMREIDRRKEGSGKGKEKAVDEDLK